MTGRPHHSKPMPLPKLDCPGDYLDGDFRVAGSPDAILEIWSPADTQDLVARHPVAHGHVAAAVDAARRAARSWRRRSSEERAQYLRAYQGRLRAHASSIAHCIAREAGKPLWDAEAEVAAMAAKIDVSLGEGSAWTATRHIPDLPGEIRYRPHGVVAVVGPFNFPGHLPNGQIVPALWLGNTVVHKPSEKTPTTATWMARCFHEAGFPPGVFNVVQGRPPSAEALVTHPDVDGILFTGSVAVGRRIVELNLDQIGRLVALELGGKNSAIVLDDADLDLAARQIAFAAYASAGQRCSATSRVIATPRVVEALTDRLAAIARRVRVGYPLDRVFMGPLISEHARDMLLAAQARAQANGIQAVVPGGCLDVPQHPGWYATPALHRAPAPTTQVAGYTNVELFGPDIHIFPAQDMDQAAALANATAYGLVASVFTRSRAAFEHVAAELQVGVVHWNRSSAGASGRLPFGGVKHSGNHRPAGVLTGMLCSYPQGVYLEPSENTATPSWPGFDG